MDETKDCPFAAGQRVTPTHQSAICPACLSTDLEFRRASNGASVNGVFACRSCGEPFIRAYTDMTAAEVVRMLRDIADLYEWDRVKDAGASSTSPEDAPAKENTDG